MRLNRVLLIIIDGFGLRGEAHGNSCTDEYAPHIWRWFSEYPFSRLAAAGAAVGLPDGVIGNSEAGHLTIGAGRRVSQMIHRINQAIADGSLTTHPVLQSQFEFIREHNSAWHLIGLLSDGQVHSHLPHLTALLQAARMHGIEQVYLHCFLDGRDTLPGRGTEYLRQVRSAIQETGVGKIATLIGRYYAMDRDNRWARTEKAYRLLVYGEGEPETDALTGVQARYKDDQTDEYLTPIVLMEDHVPVGTIRSGDAVFAFNFRADRMRQLLRAFGSPHFAPFERKEMNLSLATMTRYDENLDVPILFPPPEVPGSLGEVISGAGLKQLRISETEKYAHVTYFLNCRQENPFPGEDRIMIPSPRGVSYVDRPEMNIDRLKDRLLYYLEMNEHDLTVLNLPNPDIIAHTGDIHATRRAIQAVDRTVSQIVQYATTSGIKVCITADHGNAEEMLTGSGTPHTAHTRNEVPFVVVDPESDRRLAANGRLSDVAPTVLSLLGLSQPAEMTGNSLLSPNPVNV